MPLPDILHDAFRSLTGALDLLEAAVERRAQVDTTRADRDQELALMQEDRARLGEDLERSEQMSERLRAAGAGLESRLARMDALCATLRQRAAD